MPVQFYNLYVWFGKNESNELLMTHFSAGLIKFMIKNSIE